jgi:hypothetical protein
MTMRDLQRLEKLSSTAALGLWADDVVLVLDRATSGGTLDAADVALLNEAAEMLDAARERTEQPLSAPRSARSLAATTTTLTIVASFARERTGRGERELLSTMATALRDAAAGRLSDESNHANVDAVMDLFGMLGEHQLVESNSVLASRKDMRTWTEMPLTSNSS